MYLSPVSAHPWWEDEHISEILASYTISWSTFLTSYKILQKLLLTSIQTQDQTANFTNYNGKSF